MYRRQGKPGIVPLKYQLKNGDTVEIITQAGSIPGRLKFVVSRAIAKIRNWVKTEERKRSLALGRDLLEKEFKKHHLKLGQIAKSSKMAEIYAEYHIDSLDDLMAGVGYGKVSPKHVVHHFLPEEETKKETTVAKTRKKGAETAPVGVSLTGIEDIMVRFGKCCDPLPGDEITGYISRGRGITVHTANCAHIREMDPDRLVDVQWDIREKREYPVQMRIVGNDKKGLLADISSAITSVDVNITHAEINISQDGRLFAISLSMNDLHQFNKVITAVKKVREVVSVERLWRP